MSHGDICGEHSGMRGRQVQRTSGAGVEWWRERVAASEGTFWLLGIMPLNICVQVFVCILVFSYGNFFFIFITSFVKVVTRSYCLCCPTQSLSCSKSSWVFADWMNERICELANTCWHVMSAEWLVLLSSVNRCSRYIRLMELPNLRCRQVVGKRFSPGTAI